jgi:hypothetical protein
MYGSALRLLRDRQITPTNLAVLVAVSLRLDRDGWCWPSYATIAADAGVHRGTAVKSIQRLEAVSLLQVVRSSDVGVNQCNHYQLVGGSASATSGSATTTINGAKSGSASPTRVVAPARPKLEPLNQTQESARAARSGKDTEDRFRQFWEAYPPRSGRRVGKARTLALFAKLSPDDQRLCIVAAKIYADREPEEDGFVAKSRDPERFIKDDWWRDWRDPAPGEPTEKSLKHWKDKNGNIISGDFTESIAELKELEPIIDEA